MKKNKRRQSGVRTIYLLIALMIVTAVFTGSILGWLIWYGISGGVSKPRETEAVETEENMGETEPEEETEPLPDVSEIPGANQQLMMVPNGNSTIMHEGNMGFTMEAPNAWAERIVSRYEEELDGTTLIFYEKENMLNGSEDNQGILFSIKEFSTTTAVLPEGEQVQVLREANEEENITPVIAILPDEPIYEPDLEQPYLEMEKDVLNVLSTFAWEERGDDIRFDLAEGVTITLPYYWADGYEVGRGENVEIGEGITGTVYDFYENDNHVANGNGLLMRLFVYEGDIDVSSVDGYQKDVAELPAINGEKEKKVAWFSMDGQYDASNVSLTYEYQYLYSSIPWIMNHNVSVTVTEETTEETTTIPETEPPTTPAPETEPPTTPAPETEPPTTPAPETEPPTTPAPETEPPTTPAPETEPPTQPSSSVPQTTSAQPSNSEGA